MTITGKVTADLDAVIALTLRNDTGEAVTTEGVVDTGFNGYLTLSPAIIRQLDLVPFDRVFSTLADGSVVAANVYLVRLLWQGVERIIAAEEAAGEPLVGMQLLLGSKMTLSVRNGGSVVIEPES